MTKLNGFVLEGCETLLEKVKMVVTTIFSFPTSFYLSENHFFPDVTKTPSLYDKEGIYPIEMIKMTTRSQTLWLFILYILLMSAEFQ